VHDGARCALDALVGALDQLGTALHQHLDRDVVGDQILLDQLADEVEVGLAGGREADLDLLEAHLHQHIEHAAFAFGIHRVDERLVAVAQVDAAPQGRAIDHGVGPRAIAQDDRHGAGVLLEGHLLGRDVCGWHGSETPVCERVASVRILRRKMKNPPAEAGGTGKREYAALALRKKEQSGAARHRG
jgi:hypothetical protein